jgi:hypothetical protein
MISQKGRQALRYFALGYLRSRGHMDYTRVIGEHTPIGNFRVFEQWREAQCLFPLPVKMDERVFPC